MCLATKLFEKFKIIKSEEIWKKITGFQNGVKKLLFKKIFVDQRAGSGEWDDGWIDGRRGANLI